jgi:hypothetical protein
MKHYLNIFFVILLFLPSLACGALSTISVQGSGKIVKQTVDVKDFDRVSLEGSGNVYIEQGQAESLTIEADDNILPLLDTRVRGSELVLGTQLNKSINPSKPILYRLTVKDLQGISLKGSGNFYMEPAQSQNMEIGLYGSGDIVIKGLDADSLSINLSGSGNISIGKIAVKTIDTTVNGSGDVKLDGKSDSQKIAISGSGNYLAGDLETVSADVRIPGSSDVTVWVTDKLNVNVPGSGNLSYYGTPTIDQSAAGSGKITSLGEK